MHVRIMRKFVKALRSGEYIQIAGTLVESGHGAKKACDGFCALGVLTDLYVRETKDFDGAWFDDQASADAWWRVADQLEDPEGEFPGRMSLTVKVREWAGMSDHGAANIMTMNDADAFNFKQIAKVVEEGYEDL